MVMQMGRGRAWQGWGGVHDQVPGAQDVRAAGYGPQSIFSHSALT